MFHGSPERFKGKQGPFPAILGYSGGSEEVPEAFKRVSEFSQWNSGEFQVVSGEFLGTS